MIFLVRRASRKSTKETEKLIVAIADNGKKEEGRSVLREFAARE